MARSLRIQRDDPENESIADRRHASTSVSPFQSVSDDNDLHQENERLKAELEFIRSQLLLLQQQQQSSGMTTNANPDEEPETMTRSLSFLPLVSGQEIETHVRRRKDEHHPSLKALSTVSSPLQRVLHHRHYKPPKGLVQIQVGNEVDCESGMVEVDSSASLNMPLLSAVPQPYSNILADSTDPIHFLYQVQDRAQWLVGLLVLQSMSSFIIARNEAMLQKHLVLVQFLTMLVGAGGNAGNQSSVRVIRGLATGQITNANMKSYLLTETKMACILCVILGTTGCVRALLFFVPMPETVAITTSLCIIVLSSIILGALLPLGMRAINIDPAHSSTTIQVIMDIMGVTITVCK
jgi:cation transporter-like permease